MYLIATAVLFVACRSAQVSPQGDESTANRLQASDDVGFVEVNTSSGETVSLGYIRRGMKSQHGALLVIDGPACIEWFGRYVEPVLEVVYFNLPPNLALLSERVAAVEDMRAALGFEKVYVFGHSEAGAVAMEYAIAHPEKAAGVVWVDGLNDHQKSARLEYEALSKSETISAEEREFANEALKKETLGLGDIFIAALSRRGTPVCSNPLACMSAFRCAGAAMQTAGYLEKLRASEQSDPPSFEQLIRAALTPDIRGKTFVEYRTLDGADKLGDTPVLMVQGAKDTTVHPETSRDLADSISQAKYIVFDASYHLPFIDENERFVSELKSFLKIDSSVEPAPSLLVGGCDQGKEKNSAAVEQAQGALVAGRDGELRGMLARLCEFVRENPQSDLVAKLEIHDLRAFEKLFCADHHK